MTENGGMSAGEPTAGAPWYVWLYTGLVGLSSLTVLFEPRDRHHPLIGVLEGALIASLALAAALLVHDKTQRGNGLLLNSVGASLAVQHLHLIDHSPFPLIGWEAGPLAGVLVAIVLYRFPGSHLPPRGRPWVGSAVAILVITRLTVSIPPTHLRSGWWPALPLPADIAEIGLTLGNAYLLLLAVWFVAAMAKRVRRSKGLTRYELAPVVFASFGAMVTIAGHIADVFTGQSQVTLLVLVIQQVGLLTIPAGFIFAALYMRSARGAVGQLVLGIRGSSTTQEIRDSLASTLSDPDLMLYVWAAEEGHWRTPTDLQRDPTFDASHLVVPVNGDDGSPLALIVTDASVAHHGQLVEASAAAVRLALQNAATMGMLRRSRLRLAEAELAERKRLERDIHDGVQQRLLALGMSMDRVVHATTEDNARELAEAAAEQVQEAIKELRELARGILPAVLTQSGLAAAVESATERLPLLVKSVIPATRWPSATEATAYFVVCEGLNNAVKHARSDRVEVRVTDDAGALTVQVRDFGHGGADATQGSGLLGLRDRVTALGGTFVVTSPQGGGTCLSAELPYA